MRLDPPNRRLPTYLLRRTCFVCGHQHPPGMSCRLAARHRLNQALVDIFIALVSAMVLAGTVLYVLREVP
jgi:hypothetical protein